MPELSAEQRERAARLFVDAYKLPAPERARFLDETCGDDPELRLAVEGLLGHHDAPPRGLKAVDELSTRSSALGGVPETIDGYRILEVLGRGGMGIVYRALQSRPARVVALKVLQPGLVRDEMLKRFEQEAELLGLLKHPGIASIYDAGMTDLGYGEMPYFAMEFVEGESVTSFADTHDLDMRARCALVATICDAVQHANKRGVVHRDLKPANILCTGTPAQGSEPQAKVLDFGVARAMDTDLQMSTMQTETGALLGTLPYMSPEQIGGDRDGIDARTDVYSLGVILYELLAGKLPLDFEGRPLTDVGRIVNHEDPALLGRIDRTLRGDIETICDKALAKERERRYGSAGEMANDLRRFLRDEPVRARPQTTLYQVRKFARRNRTLVGGVVATFVALVVGMIGIAIFAAGESAQKRAALEAKAAQRRDAYRFAMRLSGDLLEVPDGLVRIREAVQAWLPQPEQPDLRGWEWFFLDARSNAAEHVFELADRNADPVGFRWLTNESGIAQHKHRIVHWRIGEEPKLVVMAKKLWLEDVHPNGVDLLCTDDRVGAFVIDAKSGKTTARLAIRPGAHAARWLPDGLGAVVLSRTAPDFRLLLWRPREDRVTWRVRGPSAAARDGLACSPDGRYIATVNGREGPSIWRAVDGTLVRHLRAGQDIFQLAWCPDSRLLAAVSVDRAVRVWDTRTTSAPVELRGHQQTVRSVDFHPTRPLLASASEDFTVRLWNLQTGASRVLGTHGARAKFARFNPDGTRLASFAHRLRIWKLDRAPAVRTITPPAKGGAVGPLAWSADGRIGAGTRATGWRIWSLDGEVTSVSSPGAQPTWSCDGRWLATRNGNRLEVREGEAAEPTWSHEFRDTPIASWSPTQRALYVRAGNVAWLWKPGAAAPRKVGPGSCIWHKWSPDGKHVAFADWYDRLNIVDLSVEPAVVRRVPHPTDDRANAGAFSPDGTRLALALRGRLVRIIDGAGRCVRELRGHSAQVRSVAWSPDGTRLASGSWDRSVRVWDPEAGVELLSLRHSDNLGPVAWSRDGQRLATASADGCVRVFDASGGSR